MEPHPVYGDKLRVVQELVPGKQITLAHIIANPQEILYRKLEEKYTGNRLSDPVCSRQQIYKRKKNGHSWKTVCDQI